jgi:hypothetical protein|tara:strand:- start:290 stop:475 length:186 start_codon:yes stop_codon:yes gene_type:complete
MIEKRKKGTKCVICEERAAIYIYTDVGKEVEDCIVCCDDDDCMLLCNTWAYYDNKTRGELP